MTFDLDAVRGRRICVIGASGFLGRPTVQALSQAGAQVVGVSRSLPENMTPNVEWLAGDVADEALIRTALSGADAVVYLASTSLPASADADIAKEIECNVRVPVQTAELALREGVGRFVFASSGGTVYGAQAGAKVCERDPTEPRNAYGVSKMAVEAYLRVLVRARGLSAASLRIGNPYGEHQSSARGQGFVSAAVHAALAGEPLRIWGDGSVVRDYVHVTDVARALALAVAYRGAETEFNVGSGEGRSLRQVVEAVEQACGVPIDIRYEPARAIDVPANVLDVSRASRVLGWRPAIPFAEGLRRTIAWRQLASKPTPSS